jgi:hypothetical protein
MAALAFAEVMDEVGMENALGEVEEVGEVEVEVKAEAEEEKETPQPDLPPPPTGALPLKRKRSGATGVLDTPWGDAQSASWTVHVSFGGGALAPDMKVDLHSIAGHRSGFIAGVMGAHAFAGDTHLTLDPSWRHCAAPLLRCLYSPEAASFFIEQLLVRKTFAQAVAVARFGLLRVGVGVRVGVRVRVGPLTSPGSRRRSPCATAPFTSGWAPSSSTTCAPRYPNPNPNLIPNPNPNPNPIPIPTPNPNPTPKPNPNRNPNPNPNPNPDPNTLTRYAKIVLPCTYYYHVLTMYHVHVVHVLPSPCTTMYLPCTTFYSVPTTTLYLRHRYAKIVPRCTHYYYYD